jgi:Calcineurin-like phosphoesterase
MSISPVGGISDGGSPVIGAVGDMACDKDDPKFTGGAGTKLRCAEKRDSDALLADTSITHGVLGLGDYQYHCSQLEDWQVSYNPTWGRLDPVMKPIVGNHEYLTGSDVWGNPCPASNSTAQTYFDHFGAAAHPDTQGHYSFDIGTWHLIGLNAQCTQALVGGCSATSAQTEWLKQDLANTLQPCILAYWHQPRFAASKRNPKQGPAYSAWWDALYAAHADVVLNGHEHNYQRFVAMNPAAQPDPEGISEYIIGTGGEAQDALVSTVTPQPVVGIKAFGYLRMALDPAGWRTEFVDYQGKVLDTSSGSCHPKVNTPSPTLTPTATFAGSPAG